MPHKDLAARREYHRKWSVTNRDKIRADYAPREISAMYQQFHRLAFPEKHLALRRAHYARTRERLNRQSRESYKRHAERRREEKRLYNVAMRGALNEKWMAKFRDNPQFKLRHNLACRVRGGLKGIHKSASTAALIGCSWEFLRGFLEARFAKPMSWANYGKVWHVDHIIPCAEFELSIPEQQKQCFHYTNLRPMLAFDNHSKGGKCPAVHQKELI